MKLSNINPKIITAAAIGIPIVMLILLIAGLLAPSRETLPSVASTSPADQSEEVILTLPISIAFAEELTAEQQASVSFGVTPSLELSQEWVSNDTLELTSARLPERTTTYTVTVYYKEREIHVFSFQTTTKTQEQVIEEGRQQAEDDFNFAEAEKEFYEAYPWYQNLPIETTKYVVVYNFERAAFRVRLTLGENPTGAEVEAAKNDALRDLENIGVDLDQYSYYVLTD